ncbi:MAG: hypothetical protein ABI970_03915, partial [Chloroflexota bacterium]
YRKHAGNISLKAEVKTTDINMPGSEGAKTLDVSATLNDADGTLTLFVVNRHPESAVKTSLSGGGQRRSFGASPVRTLLKAMPFMNEDYKNDLRTYALGVKKQLDSISKVNPYGVPLGQGGFYSPGGNFSGNSNSN